MIRRHETRRPEYFASSHWLQGAVFLVVVGALSYAIVQAVNEARDEAERLVVDLTIRNMRTGMQLAIGEAIMRQRENEIAAWAGGDPTRWLEVPPQGYRGECSVEERRNLPEGAWCFERDSRQLVYRPRNAKQLRDPGDGQACNQLAWRVVRVADGVVSGGFVGVRIEPASICRWFLEGVEKAGK